MLGDRRKRFFGALSRSLSICAFTPRPCHEVFFLASFSLCFQLSLVGRPERDHCGHPTQSFNAVSSVDTSSTSKGWLGPIIALHKMCHLRSRVLRSGPESIKPNTHQVKGGWGEQNCLISIHLFTFFLLFVSSCSTGARLHNSNRSLKGKLWKIYERQQ